MIYLGIDGGGSKTKFLLEDDNGAQLGRAESGPSNWVSAGPTVVRDSLARGLQDLSPKPDIVCAGFAGAARPEAAAFYRKTLDELLPNTRILIETDAFIAYVGAIGLRPGVLLIAGTGSIALARDTNGRMTRVGGWGPYFSDEGSGFWIGREAVRSALRARDTNRHPEFVRAITSGLGVEAITDVVSAWNSGSLGVPRIAALAQDVLRYYPNEPAKRIITEAAGQLRDIAQQAIDQIDVPDAPRSVVGSIGNHPIVQQIIGLEFRPPAHPPERGAVEWARASGLS